MKQLCEKIFRTVFASDDPRQSRILKFCFLAVYTIAYLGAAELGYLLSFPGDNTSFWPPSGLALVVFWLVPAPSWPLLLIASALASMTSDVGIHQKPFLIGLGFWIANTTEVLVAVSLLKIWTGRQKAKSSSGALSKSHALSPLESVPRFLETWQNILALLLLACTVAACLGATIGAATLSVGYGESYWPAFRMWWAADALGMLVIGSIGLSIAWEVKSTSPTKTSPYVVLLLMASLTGLASYTFALQSLPIAYAVLPLLFLLALLGEFLFCSVSLVILAIIAIACTTRGLGPFSGALSVSIQAALLQIYLVVCTVSTLMFTAIVRQRNLDLLRSDYHQQLQAFVFQNAAVDIAWIESDGSIRDANPQFCSSLGYSHEEMLGLKIQDIAPRSATVEWSQAWAGMKQAGVLRRESILRRKNGSIIDVEIFASFSELMGTEMLLACVTNITQRKRSNELISALVESSSDAHLIFDHTGIIECNQAAVDMMRMESKQQMLLRHPAEFSPEFQPDGRTSMEKSIEMDGLARTNGFHRFDWMHTRANGEVFPCEVTLTPIQLESGDALLVVWHEISERIHFQAQLQNANQKLTVINEELTQFAYIASHDLKAPLRAINSLADFVIEDCEEKLPVDSVKHLRAIKQRIFRMQRLLEDLLEYSQAGQDQSSARTMSARKVIEEAIELCEIPAAITVELTGSDAEVFTWITPLETCLRNLIGNSVKHRDSSSGRIWIHSEQTDDFFTFSVADDGRGIPAEHHERVFRMFEALRRRDEVEGSGMGLAVVKKTVETYGGSITLESPNPWAGTTFHLRWPHSRLAST